MSDEQLDSDLDDLVSRLEAERAVPAAAFRGELRRGLLQARPGMPRPRRLRGLITAYAGGGLALFAIAIIGVAGAGPLAA